MTKLDPEIDWQDPDQWEYVYSPSSDTFFLCDGLVALSDRIPDPCTFLEVGSGSGYVTAFAARLCARLNKTSIHITTDINMRCCAKTRDVCAANKVRVFPICDSFAHSFRGPIDIIVFNPPYVETPDSELIDAQKERGISASWAGGEDGAEVIYDFLEFLVKNPGKMSENYLVILLISQVNCPGNIKKWCKKHCLAFEIILDRNCQGESLKIVALSPLRH
jgi:release factor glutamine methyltransferase